MREGHHVGSSLFLWNSQHEWLTDKFVRPISEARTLKAPAATRLLGEDAERAVAGQGFGLCRDRHLTRGRARLELLPSLRTTFCLRYPAITEAIWCQGAGPEVSARSRWGIHQSDCFQRAWEPKRSMRPSVKPENRATMDLRKALTGVHGLYRIWIVPKDLARVLSARVGCAEVAVRRYRGNRYRTSSKLISELRDGGL